MPWIVQVLLYASPVAYALQAVPTQVRGWYAINPLTWLLEAFRWSMLGTAAPPLWQLVAAPAVALGVFFFGAMVFQRYERTFADLI